MLEQTGISRDAIDDPGEVRTEACPRVLLVGSPNVGKSQLFYQLTGKYCCVSNYPGTTVEITSGTLIAAGRKFSALDTPGLYSLSPLTEEERVALDALASVRPHAVLHVIDSKNIARMICLTLQLIEAGLPVIVVLNLYDEARALGIEIDDTLLGHELGVPVIKTVATSGEGVRELKEAIAAAKMPEIKEVHYGRAIEEKIKAIQEKTAAGNGVFSSRAHALLNLLQSQDGKKTVDKEVLYETAFARHREAERICRYCVVERDGEKTFFRDTFSRLLISPLTGFPILLLVLYFGFYLFVGRLAAGTVVNWLEADIFSTHVNPVLERVFASIVPWPVWRSLFVGDYGMLTFGLRYALALILPIVTAFFLVFSLLEDSGYLPRLAMLLDRSLKKIGLSGRAVIPLVLGFGCDTMATLVTRTLETRREKIIAAILLALAIPCSAQLGVILGLLSGRPLALALWGLFIIAVFLTAGFLASRILPGRKPVFYMELPPLRVPRLGNIATKTFARLFWYLEEVIPLFLLASFLIWAAQLAGAFRVLLHALEPLVRALGLPDEAAQAFLFGFFRRDYGSAGLYELQKSGALSGAQLLVAAITLTLFLPCIAQLLIMKKERGLRFAAFAALFVLSFAFAAGYLVNVLLQFFQAVL